MPSEEFVWDAFLIQLSCRTAERTQATNTSVQTGVSNGVVHSFIHHLPTTTRISLRLGPTVVEVQDNAVEMRAR